MNAFTTVAEFYEILSDNETRLAREGPFLKRLLEEAPGNHVVDIACGTGIHAEFFATLGALVTALDISRDMIDHARSIRPNPAVTFRTGDMRNVAGGHWDLAVCLGNSLSLLTSPDDLAMTFSSVRSSLAEGGLFLFQILNYRSPSSREPRHRVIRKQADGADVTAVKILVPQGEYTFLSLAFFSNTGETIRYAAEAAILRNWTESDVIPMLEKAGYAVRDIYGGLDCSIFNHERSEDFVVVAVTKGV